MRTVSEAPRGSQPASPLTRGAPTLALLLGICLLLLLALGWRGASYPTPITDLGSYFLPKYQYAADRIASGELPLWNPYEFGGIPFLATIQPAVFYPPLRLVYAFFGGETAYTVTFFLHVLIGSATTLVLMRSFGVGPWPAALASLWVVQPTWLMRVWDHPVYIWGSTWLPLLILLVRRVVRAPDLRGAGWLALVAATQIWSGYPPMVLAASYLLLLGLPFFFAEPGVSRDAKSIFRVAGTLAIAAVVTALSTAAQVLPSVDLAAGTDRATEAVAGAALARRISESGTRMGFWIGIPRVTFAESLAALWNVYGPLLLGLGACAVILRRRSPPVWFGVAGLVLCSLLPLHVYQGLPLYGFVRFALEWAFMAPLMVHLLAGFGLDALARRLPDRRFAVALATIAVAASSILWSWQSIDDAWRVNQVDLGLEVPADLTTPCDLDGSDYRSYWGPGQLRGSLLRGGVRSIGGYEQSLLPRRIADLSAALGIGNGGINVKMPRDIAEKEPGFARFGLRCLVSDGSPWLEGDRFEKIRDPSGRLRAYRLKTALPRARLAHAARFVRTPEEALSLVSSAPPDMVVLEGDPEPLPACPESASGAARIVTDEPEHVAIRVDAPCPAYLVLADVLVDGWSATLDGTPVSIRAADYAFRAVRVPAGRHEVVFRYAPASVRVGLFLSALGLIAVSILLSRRSGLRCARGARPGGRQP